MASRLLDESSERWGHYLGLLDSDAAEPLESLPEPEFEDAPAAIDTGTLVRLLTGSSPAPTVPLPAAPRFEVPNPPLNLAIDPELRDIFLAEGSDIVRAPGNAGARPRT